ncbi:hypothetical protein EMCRGX_G034471 [Ephydatia muelleri]
MSFRTSCARGINHVAWRCELSAQQIASKDPQQEGFPLHELRPHMLLPAATLPVNAELFQGLLGAMEANSGQQEYHTWCWSDMVGNQGTTLRAAGTVHSARCCCPLPEALGAHQCTTLQFQWLNRDRTDPNYHDWSKYQAKSIKLGMNQFSPLFSQKAEASMDMVKGHELLNSLGIHLHWLQQRSIAFDAGLTCDGSSSEQQGQLTTPDAAMHSVRHFVHTSELHVSILVAVKERWNTGTLQLL